MDTLSVNKYRLLIKILDQIRQESFGNPREKLFLPEENTESNLNSARSRAFIHLFLKVKFGLLEFANREHYITDGTNDGGIDAYFISQETKTVYLLQSKFRANEENFSSKEIAFEEILSMDVNRILDGNEFSEAGNAYGGKILQLQREINQTENIARYKYKVVILANLREISPEKLSRLVGGYPCEVVNYERSFDELAFPVISGTYFQESDVTLHLDLSNKNAGSKISYTVDTRYGDCDITVLFVPTIEIAKMFRKYKNSMLRFNPRSYLDLEGAKVNQAIRDTILEPGKNEFALYNNGITMLSEETFLNEKIGQRNKAQLNVRNPQIINGGQTAFTLSRILEEKDLDHVEASFDGKEVLLKVITLNTQNNSSADDKLELIESISIATNAQTAVQIADRFSNEDIHLKLQKSLYHRFGILYERKRGEFQDGVQNGYVDRAMLVERNLLIRIFLATKGQINLSAQRKAFLKFTLNQKKELEIEELNHFYFGFLCFQALVIGKSSNFTKRSRELSGKLYAMSKLYRPASVDDYKTEAIRHIDEFLSIWLNFMNEGKRLRPKLMRQKFDKKTREISTVFDIRRWFESNEFEGDVKAYFSNLAT